MALTRLYHFNIKHYVRRGLLKQHTQYKLLVNGAATRAAGSGADGKSHGKKESLRKPKTPLGRFDSTEEASTEKDSLEKFPDDVNPATKERGGPKGPEPTRYGDWERRGRCIDF
uniref:Succinate dehydrogenase assembly factor 4, mitochondrial n=1 Tax=Lepisosteus oculatus TaxID=7918 RepID=W5NKH1_LEPOC